MTHYELRQKFIKFFTTSPRNHKEIPSAPLVPENDPTVLFITAGMHPLVPYLMGEPHPLGKRLCNIQKIMRTDDIDEVGDLTHNTFFEMLGNWSLGDYFKKEAIEWSFEFITSKKWLNFNPEKIYISVFQGDNDAPKDSQSIVYWQQVFKSVGITAKEGNPKQPVTTDARIFPYPKDKNWWGPAGQTGPCGPDTEMFYDTELDLHDKSIYGPFCHINCDCGRYIEFWNDVFMQYNKKSDGSYVPLKQQNVDTGMGLERITALLSWLSGTINIPDPFLTDLFKNARDNICLLSGRIYEDPFKKSIRIILDHCRAVVFIIADGVEPGNKERGYVVRRLIRRSIRHGQLLGIHTDFMGTISVDLIDQYKKLYPELEKRKEIIQSTIETEERKFQSLLSRGLKEIEKYKKLNGKIAFDLYQNYGFPPELTFEIAKEKGHIIDKKSYQDEYAKHQQISRTATKGVFKGGLQDHTEETTKLHTATHLLQQALRDVLGNHVHQKGSHITAKRLRFDFSHTKSLTTEEIKTVEKVINEKIKQNLRISSKIYDFNNALEDGARTVVGTKYPVKVKVYSIGTFSKEVCGGPHVDFTGKLGKFKIIKEEAAGTLSRRIYAVLTG